MMSPGVYHRCKNFLSIIVPELRIVAGCGSSDEAKEKIHLLKPGLVFLDIAMPEKTGFDLLHELGEINFEIIFVTAHNDFMTPGFPV